MKPIETLLSQSNKEKIVMWISLLYGGFAIIYFLIGVYSVIWIGEPFFFNNNNKQLTDQNIPKPIISDVNLNDLNRFRYPPRMQINPLMIISSPESIIILLSGLISIAAGLTIMKITRKNEIKKIKQETTDYLLLPEEKKVIEILKKNDYSLPQNKITKETGLTKVQVHRVLKRLETKGLIEKYEYGLTNKIVLKKEFFD